MNQNRRILPNLLRGREVRALGGIIGVGKSSFLAGSTLHPDFRSQFLENVEGFRGQGNAALLWESLFQQADDECQLDGTPPMIRRFLLTQVTDTLPATSLIQQRRGTTLHTSPWSAPDPGNCSVHACPGRFRRGTESR